MRLKSIKLAGFKSFVDPTTIHFPGNMCAIVGPNGCGKSNVIDAVRWVMGESSAKNLRGESMADVIFNGSVNRQPVGQASIELVFDNTDGRAGGEFASYAEIATKRQVSRDGQSEYFLNGTRCRRRDITDIFLGTGLGPRSYAIIEQGMISRLIESRPEELRVFIEEAAGISKYRERRRETESRMHRTQENLERLTDLRDELGRQLQNLQRQAQAAERYAELKAQERETRAQLLAMQWRTLDVEAKSTGQAIGELEVRLEAVQAEHQQVDTAIEQFRVEHTDFNDAFNQVQGHFYALGAEVSRIEQTIKHQQERARQLSEDRAQTAQSLAEAERHLDEDGGKLRGWQAELDELSPQLAARQEAEQSSSANLQRAEDAMHSWQHEWDEFNQHAAEPRQQAEVQQSRIQQLEQVLQRLQDRSRQLEQEQAGLAAGPDDGQLQALEQALAAVAESVSGHEERGETLVTDIAAARDNGTALSAALNRVRTDIQQLRGRIASLEALQQAALEDRDAAVGQWLAARELRDRPRLLDHMAVDDGWQLAVETVLGDYLQAVCVDDLGPLGDQLAELAAGQLALVEAGGDLPAAPEFLASKVRSGGRATALLAGVRVANDLGEALHRRSALAAHESIVTPDGIWLGPNWLRVTRRSGEDTGIIRRRDELAALAERMAAAQEDESRLADELTAAQQALRDLETQHQACQRDLQASHREHTEANAQLSAHRAKVEQVNLRRERVRAEIDDVRRQFQQEQAAIGEARTVLAAAIERMDSDSRQRETLLATRDRTRTELDGARQQARQDRDAAHQLAMRHQSLQTQLQAMNESVERTQRQAIQLRERSDSLQQALAESESPLPGLREELSQQLELRLAAEGELSAARQQVADAEYRLRDAEQRRAAIEHRAEGVRRELEQQRLSNQTLTVQRATVERQLADDEQVIDTLLSALPEDANEAAWQLNLEKTAQRIVRLGPINLAAIDEFNQQSERKNYLDAQDEDLTTALDTLQNAIRKIDRETRNRFSETFDQVNSGLSELFPRVFGGGSAYLEMTGEDLLDTGITIMARPPGKKNSTIHLLSGGEKALTAIALVFSIFQLNPAPFCILDEVDAPLDDANTGRYARLVKEMSEKVQFIYITHNKISMEIADQLMGVTMHEPGVSRMVSVDVEEAAELAAS